MTPQISVTITQLLLEPQATLIPMHADPDDE